MSKKLEELERELSELKQEQATIRKAVDSIERTEQIKRVIKDQNGSPLKYIADILKIVLAIVIIASGSRMASEPWVTEIINGS